MIVKNESPVILRALASVKPLIDYWVIVDTGSTDGTQEIIREFMHDIPGELYEKPWINFGYNRNEALLLAKGTADFVLFIDADEVLTFDPAFKLPVLDQDCYYFTIQFDEMGYTRVMLINNHLNWRWEGVLHEYLACSEPIRCAILQGVINVIHTDGNRSTDPQKYQKDVALLEKALLEDPTNKRYTFYLAQSYKDAGNYAEALKTYEKRVALQGWQEEVFWSMLQGSVMKDLLNYPSDVVIDSYTKAFLYRPTRAEPLYRIANFHRRHNDYEAEFIIASKGIQIVKPDDILFVENWVYDWGLLLEFSIAAYWLEKYNEALLASLLMLKNEHLPEHIRTCINNNLFWIRSKF